MHRIQHKLQNKCAIKLRLTSLTECLKRENEPKSTRSAGKFELSKDYNMFIKKNNIPKRAVRCKSAGKILHVASRKVEVVIQNYCIVVILTLFTSFTYCVRYVTSFPGAPFGSTVSTDSDQ